MQNSPNGINNIITFKGQNSHSLQFANKKGENDAKSIQEAKVKHLIKQQCNQNHSFKKKSPGCSLQQIKQNQSSLKSKPLGTRKQQVKKLFLFC